MVDTAITSNSLYLYVSTTVTLSTTKISSESNFIFDSCPKTHSVLRKYTSGSNFKEKQHIKYLRIITSIENGASCLHLGSKSVKFEFSIFSHRLFIRARANCNPCKPHCLKHLLVSARVKPINWGESRRLCVEDIPALVKGPPIHGVNSDGSLTNEKTTLSSDYTAPAQ